MKKLIVLTVFYLSSLATFAINMKAILSIDQINLDEINIGETISNKSSIESSPKTSAAVVYMLYGSAKKDSELKEARLIVYKDKILPLATIKESKSFLMEVFELHPNTTTKAMALSTLSFAFPKDQEVADWLTHQYLFFDYDNTTKAVIIGTIRTGNYANDLSALVVKHALHGTSADLVINAATCIKDNPTEYKQSLPDLITGLLSIEERVQAYSNFGSKKNVDVCYLQICQAISMYEEAKTYLPILEAKSKLTPNNHIERLIRKIK
jgi:hypothetical protein